MKTLFAQIGEPGGGVNPGEVCGLTAKHPDLIPIFAKDNHGQDACVGFTTNMVHGDLLVQALNTRHALQQIADNLGPVSPFLGL